MATPRVAALSQAVARTADLPTWRGPARSRRPALESASTRAATSASRATSGATVSPYQNGFAAFCITLLAYAECSGRKSLPAIVLPTAVVRQCLTTACAECRGIAAFGGAGHDRPLPGTNASQPTP